MATFPALEPNTRSYDFGVFPLTEEPSVSAGIVRFRHNTVPQGYQLTLGYKALTDANANLIRTHFQGQGGSYLSFSLPSVIWKGHTFSGDIAPYQMLWRYSISPEEEHMDIGNVNVTVALVSDGTTSSDVPVVASIAAGTATGA